ncbi:aldo/keto reductase [Gemmata sp.]|uniref:aldo/keto reductase n=1 Tax=Gemmata sp. TaxID=1914242 RepID=UPI003F71D722
MVENEPFAPRRELGRTGFVATALGIGDLADRGVPIETCVAKERRAIDAGLNVIDTAPNYEDGYSEEIVGRTVRERPRDSVFVIDKVDHHDRPVGPQIDASLARLGLGHADLFVFHGLSAMDAFDRLSGPGGGFDQLADAVRAGRCRFRGVSSHSPEVLRAALDAGVCDVVLFPVGPFVDTRYVTEVLPLAKSLGVGTVCFKAFGAGKLVGDTSGYNQPLKARPRGKPSSGGSDESEAALPRLFRSFEQADQGLARTKGGLGLGWRWPGGWSNCTAAPLTGDGPARWSVLAGHSLASGRRMVIMLPFPAETPQVGACGRANEEARCRSSTHCDGAGTRTRPTRARSGSGPRSSRRRSGSPTSARTGGGCGSTGSCATSWATATTSCWA